MVKYRGRFAPSPTGDLHLGCVASALVTWLAARQSGGSLVLRMEDIDLPRVVAGMAERQMEELRWLGLDWDEGPDREGAFAPYTQSARFSHYEAAIGHLARRGLVYFCDCSRKEIMSVASAPHIGEEGPVYSGSCRKYGLRDRPFRRPPAVRVQVPDRLIVIEDRFQESFRQNLARDVGDFVLKRGDGTYAYQLAVVVDDLAMGVTEVVRGADLLSSAPRQVFLAELLGGTPPTFAHVPLVRGSDGNRLAKRARGVSLVDQRRAGRTPGQILGGLAAVLGLVDGTPEAVVMDAARLLDAANLARLQGCATIRLPAVLVDDF